MHTTWLINSGETMYKHGLAVMRCQPFHNGHKRIIDQMLTECERVTLVLGSIDKRDKRNPFPFHDRKKMVKNTYTISDERMDAWTQQIVVLGVPDISDDLGWATYVLRSVEDHWVDNCGGEEKDYLKPDAYYTGSEFDARWYRDSGMKINIIERIDKAYQITSATIIRDLCEYGDDRWKQFVPESAHTLVEKWVSRIQFLAHER